MCHGQQSKTTRWIPKEPRHKNAIPYKRTNKHKADYANDRY